MASLVKRNPLSQTGIVFRRTNNFVPQKTFTEMQKKFSENLTNENLTRELLKEIIDFPVKRAKIEAPPATIRRLNVTAP